MRISVGISGILNDEIMLRRFNKKMRRDDSGCWLWTAAVKPTSNGNQYGSMRVPGIGTCYAHRVAHALFKCDVPAGSLVIHACDVTLCVNPDHLRIGTHKDNTRDMIERGRSRLGDLRGSESPIAKLTEAQIPGIRARLIDGETAYDIAPDYGVSHAAIYQIAIGKSWCHVPGEPTHRPKKVKRRRLSDDDVRSIRDDDRPLHIVAAHYRISETYCWNIQRRLRKQNVE